MRINKMEIWDWLKKQGYAIDYDSTDQFKMYYELDMPEILEDYYQWKTTQEKMEDSHREMDRHLRSKSGIGGL